MKQQEPINKYFGAYPSILAHTDIANIYVQIQFALTVLEILAKYIGYLSRMNNTSFFKAIQYQYNTRARVLQYNNNIIPMQY